MKTPLKSVLIAEDERPMAKALAFKFSRAGFKTAIAKDGKEALAFLKKKRFDFLVLDLVMPRLDGFGVLKALREQNAEVPVIILSNLSQEGDIARVKALGARGYFIKTDTPLNTVVARVREILAAEANH